MQLMLAMLAVPALLPAAGLGRLFRAALQAAVEALARRRVPRLEVYVASDCPSCAEARSLATATAARFPRVDVRTIDVDAKPAGAVERLPVGVVAVPTYLLDGRVVALGNPEPERLFALVSSTARAGEAGVARLPRFVPFALPARTPPGTHSAPHRGQRTRERVAGRGKQWPPHVPTTDA